MTVAKLYTETFKSNCFQLDFNRELNLDGLSAKSMLPLHYTIKYSLKYLHASVTNSFCIKYVFYNFSISRLNKSVVLSYKLDNYEKFTPKSLNYISTWINSFLSRWLSLMLSQEFPLPDVLSLWDALLTDDSRWTSVKYVIVSRTLDSR